MPWEPQSGQEGKTVRPVTIYTTDYCPYCTRAKRVLEREGVTYQEIDVGNDTKLRDDLVRRSGQQTVPQIFVGEESIGGCTDLERLVQNGQFRQKLQAE